jgi:hypothetical protein
MTTTTRRILDALELVDEADREVARPAELGVL